MLCNLRCQEWNHVALRRTSSCHEQRCSLGMESASLTMGALSYLISHFSAEIRTMENEQCWGEGTNSSCALGITAKAGCALKVLMTGNWCQIMSRETALIYHPESSTFLPDTTAAPLLIFAHATQIRTMSNKQFPSEMSSVDKKWQSFRWNL